MSTEGGGTQIKTMTIDELKAAAEEARVAERAARDLVYNALVAEIATALPHLQPARHGSRHLGVLVAHPIGTTGNVCIGLDLPEVRVDGPDIRALIPKAAEKLRDLRAQIDAAIVALEMQSS